MTKSKRRASRTPAQPTATSQIARSLYAPFSDETYSQRILTFAMVGSILLHAIFLAVHFTVPTLKPRTQSSLDVVLVNVKHDKPPTKAEVLAQHNVNGGGNVDRNVRAKTALPPQDHDETGDALVNAQKRQLELEERNRDVLTRKNAKTTVSTHTKPADQEDEPTPTPATGADIMNSLAEIKRIEGELAQQTENYAKRPRLQVIGSRAKEYRFAQYVEDWRAKVERVGTLNYPEAARGKIYGSLVVSVKIKADGGVVSAEITKSSGHKVLDDAALRTVKLAAPYQSFPPNIRVDTDQIEIVRTWTFTNEDKVVAQ